MPTNFLLTHKPTLTTVIHCAIITVVFAISNAFGQTVPPPMKFVPTEDRKQLSEVQDIKSRVKLVIELSEERLSKAENLTNIQQFDKALTELGYYHGLIEEAMESLESRSKGENKTRDLFKKFEITLRKHSSRLQLIRRITPNEYNEHIDTISDYIIEARNRSINAFFGHTVLKDKPNKADIPVTNKSRPTEKKP